MIKNYIIYNNSDLAYRRTSNPGLGLFAYLSLVRSRPKAMPPIRPWSDPDRGHSAYLTLVRSRSRPLRLPVPGRRRRGWRRPSPPSDAGGAPSCPTCRTSVRRPTWRSSAAPTARGPSRSYAPHPAPPCLHRRQRVFFFFQFRLNV